MSEVKQMLTLARPALYQIKVPGEFDERWLDWDGEVAVAVRSDDDDLPETTLTGTVDQAALQGLLRRLYAWGYR